MQSMQLDSSSNAFQNVKNHFALQLNSSFTHIVLLTNLPKRNEHLPDWGAAALLPPASLPPCLLPLCIYLKLFKQPKTSCDLVLPF